MRALLVLLIGLYIASAALIAASYGTPITEVWPYVVIFVAAVLGVIAAGFAHPRTHVEGTHGSLSFRDLLATSPWWATAAMFGGTAVMIAFVALGVKDYGYREMSVTTETLSQYPSLGRSWLGVCLGISGWGMATAASAARARL